MTTLVVLAACVGYGVLRTPTYSAESRVSVSKVDVETQALPGYAQAALSLASAYARAVPSTPVQRCVSGRAGQAPSTANLSASPIPESPVIRVDAKGASSAQAIAMANAGGRCLVTFVERTAGPDDNGAASLEAYRAANVVLDRRERALKRAQDDVTLADTPANRRAAANAAGLVAAQKLVVSSLSTRYQQETSNDARTNFVQLLVRASSATSDRMNVLALLGVSGLVVGVLLGLSLAGVLELRRRS